MTTRRRGVLIALEGIDGAGKSSVARALAGRWRRRGVPVARRREPVDRALGRAAVVLAARDPWASALLFSLDRLAARSPVRADLARGTVVLQDRSYYSTLAYQADRLTPDQRRRIETLQERVAVPPDVVVWLDLPAEEAVRRVGSRGRRRDAIERTAFLRRVRAAYRRRSVRAGWIRIDARPPLRAVVDAADRALADHLPAGRTRHRARR